MSGRSPARSLAGVTVLLVDDNVDSLDIFRTALAHSGASIRTAESAREALDILRAQRPHVIVTDLAMPHEDGFWLLDHLRRLPHAQGGSIPAIAITARRHRYTASQATDAAFDVFFTKPIDPFALVEVIAKLAGR